ncbi:MAG: hypothetical protein C0624_03860 [Desulfuromonas sp.]|nr:MAG: hypothetical protein C0624_03860 [Desulfuromonas sp.]
MKLKIVIIDDEESIRDSLAWYLEDLGHEVITAAEPSSCEIYQGDRCSQQQPCGHALITDYHLPQMTGLEFVEAMTQRGCKGITANKLIMSGNANAIDRHRAEQLGCLVVQKPLRFAFVERWLEEVKKRINTQGCTACDEPGDVSIT